MEVAPKTAPAAPAAQIPNATPVYKYIRAESTNALFLAKLARSRKLAGNLAHTKSASVKIAESEKAQNTPAAESRATSNEGQVAELGAKKVEPKSEDIAKNALREGIQHSVPASLEAIDNFKASGKGKQIGQAVMARVSSDVGNVKAGFGAIGTPKAAAPAPKGTALPPMEQAPPEAEIRLGAGVVPAIEKKELDNTDYLKKSNDLLKQEEISQEQLDMVDKGDLAKANKERQNLNKEATAQPQAVQQMAATERRRVDVEMHTEEKNAKGEMQRKRQGSLTETGKKQEQARIDLEKKREEVAQNINKRYETCQRSITAKLDALEKNSLLQFDAGQAKATKDFEEQVKRDIDKFKNKRYDRFGGGLLWLKDKLVGIDDFPEVKQAFDSARAAFVSNIDALIAKITKANNDVIAGCKKELEDTKVAIADYVKSLGPQLRDVGKKAQEDVGKKLQALSGEIDRRKEKMQEKLAEKRKAAMEAIDKKIEAMKASMSGALSIIGNLLLKAAMKFFQWALEAAGVSPNEIMGIINKGVAVIKAIVTKPIVFVKNLINAAKTGFKNFGTNFLKHLKDAVFNWLTGALEGVTLPKVWDTKGIFSLVLDILGLTYPAIKLRMIKVLGEPTVNALEKGFTLVKTLVTEGPIAAWEQLKGMAEEIKNTFVEAIKSWIQNTIIYKAIEWVISIFIPGAGIIKAIIGIYDTVMFFIQKAKDIARMVGDFLGSIAEIAMGNIGAAAAALEGGLAKALSLVINFLARLLRLSGITDKIKKVIEMVRGKVGMILDKIVAWIAGMVKKGVGVAKDVAGKIIQWWRIRKAFSVKGETHSLSFSGEKDSARLIVASDPMPLTHFVAEKRKEPGVDKKTLAKIEAQIKNIEAAKKLPEVKNEQTQQDIEKAMLVIIPLLISLLDGVDVGSSSNPLPIVYTKRRAGRYPTIYIGPTSDKRITQDDLKSAQAGNASQVNKIKKTLDVAELAEWAQRKYEIKACYPTKKTKLPNGAEIGITDEFQVDTGTRVEYSKGKTKGGGLINSKLKPYGFFAGEEKYDGDHIVEMQIGGPNELKNLWPLERGENRASGSLLKNLIDDTKKKIKPGTNSAVNTDQFFMLIEKTKT